MGSVCGCCRKSAIQPTSTTITRLPSAKYEVPRTKSPRLQREYPSEASFNNTGISTSNPLSLIEGYQNEPVVSLEEALGYFYNKIDRLPGYVQEAKAKCHYPSEHGLTRDESAAIYIYTMRWGQGCLYNELQTAWKTGDRQKLKPWHKYLKLFKSAYDKLPNAKGEIWQGQSLDAEKHMVEILNSKPSTLYSGMDSYALSKDVVEQDLNNRGDRKKLLLGYQYIGGKLIAPYAANGSSKALVWPGMKLSLSNGGSADAYGSLTFHLTGASGLLPSEPIKKPQKNELHFVCRNIACLCSISIQFSMDFRNKSSYWMGNDIVK